MSSPSSAESVLQALGITDPSEIDLEAIAWHLGGRVKFCNLDGCEARIIGYGNNAIVRVQQHSHPRRRRFSIGHELGHWHYHRGRMLFCRSNEIGDDNRTVSHVERTANLYAADLILPRYLFNPIIQQFTRLDFDAIRKVASLFEASLTATAIRAVNSGYHSAVLVCHNRNGRKWFCRSSDVSDTWFPHNDLDYESFAFELLFGGGNEEKHPRLIGADAWFNRRDAQRFDVHEHSVRIANDEILTLLQIIDDGMLAD